MDNHNKNKIRRNIISSLVEEESSKYDFKHPEIIAIALIGLAFIYSVATSIYILAAGKVGLFVVKRKLPMLYPSGTIVIKGFKSGYVDIDYSVYKDKLTWGSIFATRDKRITHVGKPQNLEKNTGIPILFAMEGEISNFDPFNNRQPEKGSELFSEIAIAEYAAGYNEAKEKFGGNDKLQIMAVILGGLTFLGIFATIVLIFSSLEIQNEVLRNVQAIAPSVKAAVESALEGISRIE